MGGEADAPARILVKRVYDGPAPEDGLRVLVDRLWPRGMSKERLAHDAWAKELAPSTEARTWFAHDPERFAGFRGRYLAELSSSEEARRCAERLFAQAQGGPITLLFAARDPQVNHAVVLREWLEGLCAGESGADPAPGRVR